MAYPFAQWSGVRNRAASMGIRVIPWVRLCHIDAGEDWEILKQRLSLLIATAQALNETIILPNYEVEAETFGAMAVCDYLYGDADWDGETAWSTLAWLQNAVAWHVFPKQDGMLLQIFPQDNNWTVEQIPEKMRHCVAHARDEGRTYVGVTYQTYGEGVKKAQPSWFDVQSYMHSTYPGNRIGHGEWSSWYM